MYGVKVITFMKDTVNLMLHRLHSLLLPEVHCQQDSGCHLHAASQFICCSTALCGRGSFLAAALAAVAAVLLPLTPPADLLAQDRGHTCSSSSSKEWASG
jgi:hypothetical protein